jgi:hypothetical protein
MPTTQLSYWTRDRKSGPTLPLEFLVHKQTARNAALDGFNDRGLLAAGQARRSQRDRLRQYLLSRPMSRTTICRQAALA